MKKYIPMTETAYYILLALSFELHGYGIIGYVNDITNGRLKLGAGTIYGTLSKMEADGLIESKNVYDRRRTYIQTKIGGEILSIEINRLEEMLRSAKKRRQN